MITTTHTTTQDQRRVLRQLAEAVDAQHGHGLHGEALATALELAEMTRAYLDATEPPPAEATQPLCERLSCFSHAVHLLAFGPNPFQRYMLCDLHIGQIATPGTPGYDKARALYQQLYGETEAQHD